MRTSQPTGVSTFASRTSPSTDQSLQKSFHLSRPDKIELKKISFPSENKKYPTAQTDTTKTAKLNVDNGLRTRTTRTPAGNMGLAEMAGAVVKQTLCYYQTLVLGDSEVLRMPPLRQAPNRWQQW